MTDFPRRTLTKGLLASALAGTEGVPAVARAAYRDSSLPTATRVNDLLGRMSLDEKVAQLFGIADDKAKIDDPMTGAFDAARATAAFPNGFGHLCSPSWPSDPPAEGVHARSASQSAEYVNAVQAWAAGTRLGIPVLCHEEALHGVRGRDATSFPQAIGLASSWDPDLVRRVYAKTAAEVRARGSHLVLTPVLDVARDPRWGRTEETYGEDPHLVTVIGLAAIAGFQGEQYTDSLGPESVFACVKHFGAHGWPENGTNIGPVMAGERTLREFLLATYEAGVTRGRARTVMTAYNEIDGVPSTGSRWLLDTLLRREWGFDGLVISDYRAIVELRDVHHVATDLADAAALAILSGCDVELPDPRAFLLLPDLIRAGRVPAQRVDQAVRRVLTAKFDAGLFDARPLDAAQADIRTGDAAGVALAREAATRTLILLRNEGDMLPLRADAVGTLAVLGISAKDTPIGEYSGVPRKVVSVLDALIAESRAGFTVKYAEGVRLTESRDWYDDKVVPISPEENVRLRAEAVDLARGADRVLLVLGDNEQTSREAWSAKHMGDRADLRLFGDQEALAEAILGLGKPVIVLLLNGRPSAIPFIAEHAAAILEGWYLGQETGNAVADVLFGRVDPGGKLPISIPRSVGQLPVYYSRKPSERRGYLLETTEPLYAFGHGLSYTRFDLSAPRLAATRVNRGEDVVVEVDVANTGDRPGDEVVQVYIHQQVASVTRPVRELKAFQRVTLRPGERRTVRLMIPGDAFALWNTDMRRVVEPGDFLIEAGPSLDALKSATLTIA